MLFTANLGTTILANVQTVLYRIILPVGPGRLPSLYTVATIESSTIYSITVTALRVLEDWYY